MMHAWLPVHALLLKKCSSPVHLIDVDLVVRHTCMLSWLITINWSIRAMEDLSHQHWWTDGKEAMQCLCIDLSVLNLCVELRFIFAKTWAIGNNERRDFLCEMSLQLGDYFYFPNQNRCKKNSGTLWSKILEDDFLAAKTRAEMFGRGTSLHGSYVVWDAHFMWEGRDIGRSSASLSIIPWRAGGFLFRMVLTGIQILPMKWQMAKCK